MSFTDTHIKYNNHDYTNINTNLAGRNEQMQQWLFSDQNYKYNVLTYVNHT